MRTFSVSLMVLLIFAAPAAFVSRGDAAEGKTVLSLDECIRKALTSAPELGESQADIDLASSKLKEAKAYRYPQIDVIGLIGPVPQARGDQVYSPDRTDTLDRITWFQRGDATLVQPLYTFGKISESMKAAEHGIAVDRAKKEQKKNEITLQVKEYYYGLLLARELKEVVLDVKENLGKARNKAQQLLDRGASNVEELDVYKLDAFSGEVDKYLAQAEKGESLALSALRARLGLPSDAPIDVAEERLTQDQTGLGELDNYIETAQARRPEFFQLREGLQARKGLVEAARAGYLPDFFLGGYISGAHAEKRTRITNPFIKDEFNHFWGGVALGLKWKLDFGITGAKLAAEQAQYNRLLSTKDYADRFIPLQVRKAYLEAQEAEKSIAATKKAYSNAKKWMVSGLSNFDFGIGPGSDIFEGMENYAKMRADYFRSIYNYNMALANLEYAIGEAPSPGSRQEKGVSSSAGNPGGNR